MSKINSRISLLPWVICLSASLFFFYEFIQGNMFASIADNIMHDFHIQADKMAYMSSIYYAANVLFLLVAGIITDKFSTRKTILVAMSLCVISTFILAQIHSFYIALLCRFVTGVGSAFCFLGPIRLASRWFPPKRMAMITGVIVTVAMTGGMLAQYPLTRLVEYFGWRNALLQIGWLGVIILVIIYFVVSDKNDKKDSSSKHQEPVNFSTLVRKIYLNTQVIKPALYTSLMNMGIAVFGAMMGSLYLIQRLGIPKETAAGINTFLFLGSIIGGPLFGWCSDKLELRLLPMKIGALASLATILLIFFLPVSLTEMKILFFFLGFFTASQIISYALVAESNSSAVTGTAVSLVSILTQSGYIIYQNLYSRLLVHHGQMHMADGVPIYSLGDHQYAGMILPIGFILALLVLIGVKETYCRHHEG